VALCPPRRGTCPGSREGQGSRWRKKYGLFEAKTRLSEICDEVARRREGVTITRRGKPLVRILPVEDRPPSILERRKAYMKLHAREEPEDVEDFEPPPLARDTGDFELSDLGLRTRLLRQAS